MTTTNVVATVVGTIIGLGVLMILAGFVADLLRSR
jgi:hypothetical protein